MMRRTAGTRAGAVLALGLLFVAMAVPAAAQAPAGGPDPVLKFFSSTELSGFVDAYYTYNFNKPSSPCYSLGGADHAVNVDNCLYNFNVAHNSFSLSLAELALEKKPTADSRGGFRVDLNYGTTAAMVNAFEPGGPTYEHIQQAYISYLPATSKGTLQFD